MSIKFCKYCGAELDPATGNCPNCGGESAGQNSGAEETAAQDRTLLSDHENNRQPDGSGDPVKTEEGRYVPNQGSGDGAPQNVQGGSGRPDDPTLAAEYAGGSGRPDDPTLAAGYSGGSGGYSSDYPPDYNSDYNSDYGPAYSSDYGPAYSSDYGPIYNSGSVTNVETSKEKNRSQALILVLVVAVVILVGVVVFLILLKTGVISLGNGGDSETTVSSEREPVNNTDGVHMNLSGAIEKRTADSGDYYVLKMGSKREFHPYAPYDETYGSKFETDEVQLLGTNVAGYVGHNVRVDGTQRYRSESAHKTEVIMEVDSVEDLGEASTVPPTTAIPVTQAPQPAVSGNSGQLRNAMKFRTGPSTSYASMGTIPKGTWVTIVGSDGDWAQIYYNGRYGWVHGTYAFGWANSSPLPQSGGSSGGGSASGTRSLRNNMKLRSGPSTSYSYSTVIPKGTTVTVIKYSGDWAYITSGYGTGWVYIPYAF